MPSVCVSLEYSSLLFQDLLIANSVLRRASPLDLGVSSFCMKVILVHIDVLALKILLRYLNLRHQAPIRIRYIVEGKNAPAEFEQKVRPERDECPERQLLRWKS